MAQHANMKLNVGFLKRVPLSSCRGGDAEYGTAHALSAPPENRILARVHSQTRVDKVRSFAKCAWVQN